MVRVETVKTTLSLEPRATFARAYDPRVTANPFSYSRKLRRYPTERSECTSSRPRIYADGFPGPRRPSAGKQCTIWYRPHRTRKRSTANRHRNHIRIEYRSMALR